MKMLKTSMIKAWFTKNQPALMLGVGIAGMVTTTVLAVRGHMKAKDLINEVIFNPVKHPEKTEDILYDDKKGNAHVKKRYWIKKTWKYYVPAAITGSLSIACLVGSYHVNQRRNAALASSLAVSEAAMTEYQKTVIDTIGEEAEKDIRDKFHTKQIERNPPEPYKSEEHDRYIDGDLCVNCYESTTQQKFWASKEQIRRAVNDLNQERLTGVHGEITFNDLYMALGISTTSSGDVLGWKLDNPVAVDIGATEVNGIPCLYITPMNWVSLL